MSGSAPTVVSSLFLSFCKEKEPNFSFLLLDVLQIFPSLPLIFLATKGDSSNIHFAVVLVVLQIIEDVSLEEKTVVGVHIT